MFVCKGEELILFLFAIITVHNEEYSDLEMACT